MALQSILILHLPSFLGTNNTGATQGLRLSWTLALLQQFLNLRLYLLSLLRVSLFGVWCSIWCSLRLVIQELVQKYCNERNIGVCR